MKTAAIICEYNPFHSGHKYQMDEVRRLCGDDTFIIALMSGNYVQRGDVALFDKHSRAEAATLGGADLVLELPVFCASQSAEFFAQGAVSILDSLGLADILAFGAETDNIDLVQKVAKLLAHEPEDFSTYLSRLCDTGMSFPAARAKAVGEILGEDGAKLLSEPNNTLAVEYCKTLFRQSSSIKPLLIPRKGAMHHSTTTCDNIASATHIRSLFTNSKPEEAFSFMPSFCKDIFKDKSIHSMKAMENAVLAEILKMPAHSLKNIADVSEGLENRIKEKALTSGSVQELADSVKTKRYTHSRIRRILLSAYLGITDADRNSQPRYVRILAHTEKGQELIRKTKKTSLIPLVRNTSQVNKLNDPIAKEVWERERVFDLIYDMFRETPEQK